MAVQGQQIEQEQAWQPQFDEERTRKLIDAIRERPQSASEEEKQTVRKHAEYHNVPFYEGEFSVLDAIKQAGGGFFEGFTTLKIADPPDNEYEAIARNLGHLVGFVPGILSGPLKALGLLTKSKTLLQAAKGVSGIKSGPMLAADYVTKGAKKIIKPALSGAIGGRVKAFDTASKFMLGQKAAHIAEGAFHLGVASSVSSVWDGVDQMWASFKSGAVAGGVFRGIGNVIPGTTTGDKALRAVAGSMFMGIPSTLRGQTTPEQIYEYLIGAYFGSKEGPWHRAKAVAGIKEMEKQASKNPKLEWEKNPEEMSNWDEYHPLVQKEMKKMATEHYRTPEQNQAAAYELMKEMGITERIPAEEWTTQGYKELSNFRKGVQKRAKGAQAHDLLGVGASGGARGADSFWSKVLHKYGFPVIHYLPETDANKSGRNDYFSRRDKGQVRGIDRGLSDLELQEGGPAIELANQTLKRADINKYKPATYNLLLRNWWQVKGANSIFAIGEIEHSKSGKYEKLNGRTVKGGTGWAVQMGVDRGIGEINVYDPRQKSWFRWSTDKNRFVAFHGTPKLKSNPALIGTRGDLKWRSKTGQKGQKLSKHAEQAMKDVAEVTFGEMKEGPDSPIKEAVNKKDVKIRHIETRKTIRNLKLHIRERKKEISEINKTIKNDKPDRIRVKELEARKEKYQKDIEESYDEIIKLHEPLDANQYIDTMTGETITDIDVGLKASEFALMKKSEYFSDAHLKELWDKSTLSPLEKRNTKVEFGREAQTILEKYVEKDNKDIKINEVVKEMNKEFNIKLSEDAVNHLRKWMRELNLGRQVIFVKTNGISGDIDFTKPERPTSITGQGQRIVEAPKLIEEIYFNEGGLVEEGGAPIVILSDVGRIKKNGMSVAVPLDKLEMHFRFTEGLSEKDARTKVNNMYKSIISDMKKNHNLYPLGGQGDKGRIIFAKVHPKAKKMSPKETKKRYLELIQTIRRASKTGEVDKKAYTLMKEAKDMAESKYGISEKDYQEMVVSNLLYDLNLNGYKDSPKNVAKLMGKGFIPSAIGFNKRNQIWMTNGYSGSKKFINEVTDKDNKPLISDMSKDGNYVYRLIEDPKELEHYIKNSLLAKSTDLTEHVDGAILVRSDVIEAINKDAGHPVSGQNKSFIVDNTPKVIQEADYKLVKGSDGRGKIKQSQPYIEKNMGALLGKYMMHDVGEAASKDMKKKGVHMLMMTSAAKQTGERLTGSYDLDKKTGELLFTGGESYELNPESVKYSSSVINDPHLIQKQIWVKQLFTNLHQYGEKEISKEVIDDIFKETIEKSFNGNPDVNKILERYKSKENDKDFEFLLNNLEDIGTSELITALKTPGLERFSERVMQRMLRIVEKDIEAQFQEGEITSEQRADILNGLSESMGPVDRLLKNIAIVGEEAASKGQPGYSGYLHKYVRDYRAAVLHNYFVKSVTRPSQENSAAARMRPYDKWMQRDFADLNKDDTIFYLDNAYKKTRIRLPDGEVKTLGEVWKLSEADPDKYKEIFRAAVLRVPMDSISGAHILNFKGFTGRTGHGIMLHSRTMRALGGADLDGDEAFIYFGGKKENGVGHGLKQSWMDSIASNKGEFYNKKGTNVTHNKTEVIKIGQHKGKTYRDLLTEGSDPNNPLKKSKALYYSPFSRLEASRGAVDGRSMLGRAVTQAQIMKSSYSALMAAEGKKDVFEIIKKGKGGGIYQITRKPREGADWNQYQREITRAQIAFGSDPLDEVGLKSADIFFETMHDAYFTHTVKRKNKAGKFVKPLSTSKISNADLKNGLYGVFKDMNRAYFSRNYEQGRRFTMDEVNYLASDIRKLDEVQKNTILPKMVEKLEGLDWSDNLFNRIDRDAIERTYTEIDNMVKSPDKKFGDWLKNAMQRSSFRVVYNDQIEQVMINKLYDPIVRNKIARDDSIEGLREFRRITKHSMFGKEFDVSSKRIEKMYNEQERLSVLRQMSRQAEDFLSNDLASMSTLLNIKRILGDKRISTKKISQIHAKTEEFKARSYLNTKERRQMDYESFMGNSKDVMDKESTTEFMNIADILAKDSGKQDLIKDPYKKKKGKKDLGDQRSASWDQMELDAKIKEYKNGLKGNEKELFDHLFIGTLRRSNIDKVKKYMDMKPAKKRSPILRDLITKLVREAAKTTQSRLAVNSEQISDVAIQNHFKFMNNMHVKMTLPSKEAFDKENAKLNEVLKENNVGEVDVMDELVQGAHQGKGYAGIKKGEVTKEDKVMITEIARILKKYNRKLGNNIPELNEQIRGILEEVKGAGKDLNSMHREDFRMVLDYLQEAENGTMFQRIWKSSDPEIQKRYWSMFPDTVNRELMAHDIKWLKKKGYFITKGGKIEEGFVRRPTYYLEILQNWIHKTNSLATGKAEGFAKEIENEFVNLDELPEKEGLFKIAMAQRELGIKDDIEKGEEPDSVKKNNKLIYDLRADEIQKEFNWEKLKDKEFTVLNDKHERVAVNGYEIVNGNKSKNLSGIKETVNKRFEKLHSIIVGDKTVFAKYKTGKYFDPETKLQPKLNWRKFIKDVENAFEKGDEIPMELGIDGMRHMSRSMMYDLGSDKQKSTYGSWIIQNTGKIPFERYWPHMFHDRKSANINLKRALEFVRNDKTLNAEQRDKARQKLLIRHKQITGDWEFQENQDWDRVDVLELNEAMESIAGRKRIAKDTVKWTDMNHSFGSMFSRKGHVPGWSLDMNTLTAYSKNLVSTYYRQLNQVVSRKVLDDAYKRMSKKFGHELAGRWDKYFKLYVQGAMGQPDVIPHKGYLDDPKMKLKGTPFAWWADSNVLNKVNKIREKLGIKSKLPKELQEFTYQDIKHWSNMEAKYELATLLAHPKTAITNIFGGSLHTIASAGPGRLKKARDIKFLKRINPKWNSLQDVEDFVVSKGIVPEFMIHELGLGKSPGEMKNIGKFIGDLSSKINSKDPIERKEVFSVAKKHGISDAIVNAASKFMSVPERALRRDAFMAHYIQAWEKFGGAITDPNHPFLIEMGKKGVKATQFLYEAPQRPFFARTALGKVMTRFQLYAWNSWRFRNNVIREAKRYGYRQGTPGFNKFQRMMTIDLFTVALGNMFLYSLFDNALPQPWGWMQDTADWMFGNEKDRERAFFGSYPTAIAPLQIITPPLARFPITALMQWARDDYTKFTDYQVYTAFPFGRIIRDVAQPGKGLIDNPSRLLEKFAGMPLRDVQRFTAQRRKEIDDNKRGKVPTVGGGIFGY